MLMEPTRSSSSSTPSMQNEAANSCAAPASVCLQTSGVVTPLIVDGKTFWHHTCAARGRVIARVHTVVDDHIFDLFEEDIEAMGTLRDMIHDVAALESDSPDYDAVTESLDAEIDQAAIIGSAVPLTFERADAECFARVLGYVRQHESQRLADTKVMHDEQWPMPITDRRSWKRKSVWSLAHSSAIQACLGGDIIQKPRQTTKLVRLVYAKSDEATKLGSLGHKEGTTGISACSRHSAGKVQSGQNNAVRSSTLLSAAQKRTRSSAGMAKPNGGGVAERETKAHGKSRPNARQRHRKLRSHEECEPIFKSHKQVQTVVDTFLVADYLHVPDMATALAKILADWMVGLTPAQIRSQFSLPDDLDGKAIDELRSQLGWPTGQGQWPPMSSLFSDTLCKAATSKSATLAVGGWHDLPWHCQQQVLLWYRSVAPDAHLVLALFVCRSWRKAYRILAPQTPHAVVEQLLDTGPTCATLRWAIADAGLPASWLSDAAAYKAGKHPARRALLSWLEDQRLLEDHSSSVWRALEKYATPSDARWAIEYKRWSSYNNKTRLVYSGDDVAKVKRMRSCLLPTDFASHVHPAIIFRRALERRCTRTASWAWDTLRVRQLVDLDSVAIDGDGNGISMTDPIIASEQLNFGALSGRMELVLEAAERVRSHDAYYLVSVIQLASANKRMDILEWVWQEYEAHPSASCPSREYLCNQQRVAIGAAAGQDKNTIGSLANIASALLFAAIRAEAWPELIDWVWARLDTQPLISPALCYDFAIAVNNPEWRSSSEINDIGKWAVRQSSLDALTNLHRRVPFQARALVVHAAAANRMDIVEWCAENDNPTAWDKSILGSVLCQKRIDIARWLYARGAPFMIKPECTGTSGLCSCNDCYCDDYAILASAASSGDLATLQWAAETISRQHGGLANCTDGVRSGLLVEAGKVGRLPMIEWLVDVAGMGRPSDIALIASCAVEMSRLNVLWWLVYERGWTVCVGDIKTTLWSRAMWGYEPALTQEELKREEAKAPCEIMLKRSSVQQSPIVAQWLINAGCWTGKLPSCPADHLA